MTQSTLDRGTRFRQRVEAIVEAFSIMQEDLDRERKVIIKQWATWAEQIMRVMGTAVGVYGELQGIAGKSLLESLAQMAPGIRAANQQWSNRIDIKNIDQRSYVSAARNSELVCRTA